ncbi:excalibur calcium-binding domain-containing protein [Pseudomonas huanghezhanensis]|uniref:excalibur calcium-binding domain-containing protein n=1 Tax=Pseudomonas huanghezhanensis TaxID=3002903 RepID=UPI00228574A9|nr:excalibur calcium-binding domain-containing protein [Pseudomonas sp. BSw22131]
MKGILVVVLIAFACLVLTTSPVIKRWAENYLAPLATGSGLASTPSPPEVSQVENARVERVNPIKCDGRKYCSQMTSCAEAKSFLQQCPGIEMDGDGDGIPCESQWCH